MGVAMLEPTLPIWMMQTMCSPKWQLGRCRDLRPSLPNARYSSAATGPALAPQCGLNNLLYPSKKEENIYPHPHRVSDPRLRVAPISAGNVLRGSQTMYFSLLLKRLYRIRLPTRAIMEEERLFRAWEACRIPSSAGQIMGSC